MLLFPVIDQLEVMYVVSEQLAWGLQEAFGISEDSEADPEKIRRFFLMSEYICTDNDILEENLKVAAKFLKELYEQASDMDYAYAPDEEGEFFLDAVLKYFDIAIGREAWKSFGTPEQLAEIREICEWIVDALEPAEDEDWDEDEYLDEDEDLYADFREKTDECFNAMLYIPDLSYDKKYPDILFWNDDFMIYRGWDVSRKGRFDVRPFEGDTDGSAETKE